VKVRAALGFAPAAEAPRPFVSAAKPAPAAPAARPSRAPITSTEWLERRGLLESLSISEAAASQESAAIASAVFAPAVPPAPRPARPSSRSFRAAPAVILDPSAPARLPGLVWWAFALLPAAFVLLKKFP
jgi:hypothetical protein